MYQPSLNFDYQQKPPVKIDAKDNGATTSVAASGSGANGNLQQTQPLYSASLPQVRYASPFEDTKKIYTIESQKPTSGTQNMYVQQTAAKQNESYSSPHFIQNSAGLAPNFSAATTPKQKDLHLISFNNNQTTDTKSKIVVQNQQESYNKNSAQLFSNSGNIQDGQYRQVATSPTNIQQQQQQLQSVSYLPAVNYSTQSLVSNQMPIIQSIIQPVQAPIQTQQVILQNPQPITYTTSPLPVMQQYALPQKISYLVESKPITQTSQIRILSPSPSGRVQTTETEYSKPLFSKVSPLSKRQEEQRQNEGYRRNEFQSQYGQSVRNSQYNQRTYEVPLQQRPLYQEQNNYINRQFINEQETVRSRQFSDRNEFNQFENRYPYEQQHQQSQQMMRPLSNYNSRVNYEQNDLAQRTAMFQQQRNYEEPRSSQPAYSQLANSKIVFRDDTDYQTRKIIENQIGTTGGVHHSRSQQSLNQFEFGNTASLQQSSKPRYESIQLRADQGRLRSNNSYSNYNRESSYLTNSRYPQANSGINRSQTQYINNETLKERVVDFMFQVRPVDLLKEYIQAIVDLERELEDQRIKIVKQPDYSIQLFYELFDANESGYIVLEEFVQGLRKLKIDADQTDVKLIFQRYSLDKNSKLDQQEFINMVVPKTYSHIDSIFVRKPYINEKNMRDETRMLMGKIMKSLLNTEVVLESIRKKIDDKQIPKIELYKNLCEDTQDSVNKSNLREYLIKIGVFAKKEEIPQIMQRFDLRDMGFFRLQEFEVELKPRFG